jgi:hypothetical protein
MADGVGQIGSVQSVKMEFPDTAGLQELALFGGDGGGY